MRTLLLSLAALAASVAIYAQVTSVPAAAGGTSNVTGCSTSGTSVQAGDGSGGCVATNLSKNADGTMTSSKAITTAAPTTSASACDWSLSNVCIITAAGSNPTVTFSNPHGGGPYWLLLNNDGTARTWTLPAAALQACTPSIASTGTVQMFAYDGTNYQGGACNSNETASILRGTERSAPAAPASGLAACWFDQTDHTGLECLANGSGTAYKMVANTTSPSISGTPFVILSNQAPANDILTCSVTGTTETAFASNYNIPANYLTASTALRIHAAFEQIAAGSVTFAPKMRIGSTAGSVTGTTVFSNPAANFLTGTFESGVVLTLAGTAAAGASVAVVTGVEGSVANFQKSSTASSNTVATNGTLLLQFTNTCGAATAGYSLRLTHLMIEGN